MFGLGFTELLFLAILGLILIGPKQLPEIARTIGRLLNELKRTTDGFKSDLSQMASSEIRRSEYQEHIKPDVTPPVISEETKVAATDSKEEPKS